MTTVIVGCGTIGLAMGAALSARGEDVFLHDVNMNRNRDTVEADQLHHMRPDIGGRFAEHHGYGFQHRYGCQAQ